MPDVIVISGRNLFSTFADCCAFELEDALVDCLGAELLCPDDRGAPVSLRQSRYDLQISVALDFAKLAKQRELSTKCGVKADRAMAYVFGAYRSGMKYLRNPAIRQIWSRFKNLQRFDHFFAGIADDVDVIASVLERPVHYLPMAVNVHKINAKLQARRIDVNGFGRLDRAVSNALSDRLNRPGSDYIFYHTNTWAPGHLTDWIRYRNMFWHIQCQSKISLSFDQLYCNPTGRAKHSYVGPRWFEGLGAGTVVMGQSPKTDNAAALLDWPDSTIDLPREPEAAVAAILDLLADPQRIECASRRNLIEMNRRHDWRHRILDMLSVLQFPAPAPLQDQLKELDRRALTLSGGFAPTVVNSKPRVAAEPEPRGAL